jgi:hypothetical protein
MTVERCVFCGQGATACRGADVLGRLGAVVLWPFEDGVSRWLHHVCLERAVAKVEERAA